MLVKRSVFDQRLAKIAVQLNYSDVKMWMKLQNSKLCPGTWINWSCVVVEQDYSILRPYLCYISFGNFFFNNNSKDTSEIWIFLFQCHPGGHS